MRLTTTQNAHTRAWMGSPRQSFRPAPAITKDSHCAADMKPALFGSAKLAFDGSLKDTWKLESWADPRPTGFARLSSLSCTADDLYVMTR